MVLVQPNRLYPYLPAKAQNALSQDTSIFGIVTSFMEGQEFGTDNLPITTIFHGVTSDIPVAVWLSPKRPTL